MNRDKLGIRFCESRRKIDMQLAGNVLGCRRRLAKIGGVLVEQLVVVTFVDNIASAPFDFADVDQHARLRIARATKDKIRLVLATSAIPGLCLRSECDK